MTADMTEPNEKNTERAVTRYCLPFGICSSNNVPSVGIEPCVNAAYCALLASVASPRSSARTPTALPKRKSEAHNSGNVLARAASTPNTEVRKSVALNAAVRPSRSEPGWGSRECVRRNQRVEAYRFPSLLRRTSYRQTWMMIERLFACRELRCARCIAG